MPTTLRTPTLETLGLGTPHDLFKNGRLPASAADLVDEVFGPSGARGSMVISGANGVVGAGKVMQFGSRLEPHGVRIVALDLPGAPDGIGRQVRGLVKVFGSEGAERIMANVTRATYDGHTVPDAVLASSPRFLLEAIPEALELKKSHYAMFRAAVPGIAIRSVTSGFPSKALGVPVAHPAFPHQINKMFEVVEPEPSAWTRLMWTLGLIPVPVGDNWSFVLDVLFCGITLAGIRESERGNLPFWKLDRCIRNLVGPNPFRAHDAIGSKSSNFLTWSCLHHLEAEYGDLFSPGPVLTARKESGLEWYPPNHKRPVGGTPLTSAELGELEVAIVGPLVQMASLMLAEKRGHLAHLNIIGELCAQYRRGILSMIRTMGAERAIALGEGYHRIHPQAAACGWHPETFDAIDSPEWQQLYVNAEHDGEVGVVTLGRENYNGDVDDELNRALDWLISSGIERLILTGDFHFTTQLVGAEISEFFPALSDIESGRNVAIRFSRTARRLHEDFRASVGFVGGKRCLGGMLELMTHCHYLVAVDGVELGFPEVTLPVVPGMEACHWPLRKARPEDRARVVDLLITGRSVRAEETRGWLVDFSGGLEDALQVAFSTAAGIDGGVERRPFEAGRIEEIPGLDGARTEAQAAIAMTIRDACRAEVGDAIFVQADHSGEFMLTKACHEGRIGAEARRIEV